MRTLPLTIISGFLLALQVPFLAGQAEERGAPNGPSREAPPFRVAFVGDPDWSAGTLRQAFQAIAATHGVLLEVREIPARGRPLDEVLAGMLLPDGKPTQPMSRWDAVVVFDQSGRLLVQRKPGLLAEELGILTGLAPRVLWILSPAPRITPVLEAERVEIFKRAGYPSSLRLVSVVSALKKLQEIAGAAPWMNDLRPDRATSLGDFLTAGLIAGRLWEIKELPTEIRLGSGATLKIPEAALSAFTELLAASSAGQLAPPEITWDYAPELGEPILLRLEQESLAFNGTGLLPSLFDWQMDGRLDLLVSARGTGECQVWPLADLGNIPARPLKVWKLGMPDCPWNSLAGREVTVFQILDFDQDRQPDFLLGTGTGELAFVRGRRDGTFGPLEHLVNGHGQAVRVPYLFSAQLGNLGKESQWTLIVGDQAGNVFLFQQEGPPEKPTWKGPTPLRIDSWNVQVEGSAAPSFADWDRDGRGDILVGSQSGSVVWVRNIGGENQAVWDFPLTLVTALAEESVLPVPYRPGQRELWRPCPGWSPCPVAADINGDHLPDLILGDINRRVVRYRDLTAEEWAEVEALLKQREELQQAMKKGKEGEQSALQATLWEVTLALLEKSRDRRYERCGWIWYLERKALASPRP